MDCRPSKPSPDFECMGKGKMLTGGRILWARPFFLVELSCVTVSEL